MQIAYYEMYGAEGLKAYEATLKYAAEKGLVVIADAKRNDIGSTAACYSKAFLGETEVNGARFSAFPSDFLTVNGYLGTDGIAPFVEDCAKRGKGIFVLVKTSNPSSGELQNLLLENGTPVYEYMGGLVEKWGEPTAADTAIRRWARWWAPRIPRKRLPCGQSCRIPFSSFPATARRAQTPKC